MAELNDKVKLYGKVAQFPKNTKAAKAYTFLENVKIPKNKIWYVLIEKQDSELQMVKYNRVEGVDLNLFVTELKKYYLQKYEHDEKIKEAFNNLEVSGENKFSIIRNIPKIMIDGKLLINKITQDLIQLLAV